MTTYNTGNPLGSSAAKDLYDNSQNFDHLSLEQNNETWPDRLGNNRLTWYGIEKKADRAISKYGYITKDSFEDGSTLSIANECLRWKSNGEYYRWDGAFPKVVPPGSTPDSAGGIGKGKWVGVGDASLRHDLSTENGAGLSGYNPQKSYAADTVGYALNDIWSQLPKVNLKDYSSLKDAIAVLATFGGGTVWVPDGPFYSGRWNTSSTGNMSTDNIRILGERSPTWDTNLKKLTGGSVIQDRFIAFANNFSVENVGFDSGKDFIDSKYPGADTTTSSHPDGGTWDAFVFGAPAAGVALRRGLSLKNVIGLMYNSQAIGHAVLTEGYTGGRLDNVTGIYGSHGVVIKGCDCYASAIYTYGQKENGLIVKADQFSDCGNVEVVGHYHARKPKGTSPWADPTYTTNAVSIDPNAVSFNGPIAISSTASAPVNHVNAQGLQPLAGVILNKIVTDGLAENGTVVTEYPLIIPGSNKVFRFTVGTLQVTNCNHVVYMAQPENNPSNQLYINRLECANITNAVVYSLDNSVITIGSLDADVIGSLYFMTGLGKIYVGNEKYSRMTGQKFISTGGGVSPSLSTGWSQSADNEIFEVCLKNNRVSVKGFLQAGTGATESIVTLPYPLRPASNPRIPAVYMISGNTSVSHVSVVDTIRTLDGTLPSGTQYVSLSGVEWDY